MKKHPKTPAEIMLALLIFIAVCVIYLIFGPDSKEPLPASASLRNMILTLAGIISLPFLVWRTYIADKQQQTERDDSIRAQRSFDNDIFIKAVEQLASDQEFIRLAAIHSFAGLLKSVEEQNDSVTRDTILSILHTFMVEKSRRIFKRYPIDNDEEKKILLNAVEEDKINTDDIHIDEFESQFLQIISTCWTYNKDIKSDINKDIKSDINKDIKSDISILADVWMIGFLFRHISNIQLRGLMAYRTIFGGIKISKVRYEVCQLNYATFKGSSITDSEFIRSNLSKASFSKTYLYGVKFKQCELKDTDFTTSVFLGCDFTSAFRLENALLKGAKYNSEPYRHDITCENIALRTPGLNAIDTANEYPPCSFDEDFNPKEYGMIDMSNV